MFKNAFFYEKKHQLLLFCWKVFLNLLMCSSVSLAMISEEEKEHRELMIRKRGEEVEYYKKEISRLTVKEEKDKCVDGIFNAYMQKAAHHFHLGQREEQLACYKSILGIEGLSKENVARTHANIAVIYIHFNNNLLAAGHLKQAETISSMSDVAKIVGPQAYNVFATTYYQAFRELYLIVPKQSLEYIKRAAVVPYQAEDWYAQMNLELAVYYDRLPNSEESLKHALLALQYSSLSDVQRDLALCFAAIGSKETNKFNDCLNYFKQIKNVTGLIYTERYLLLAAVAFVYMNDGNMETSLRYYYSGQQTVYIKPRN